MIAPADITGLILAGGRGSRMGGVDKGLQPFGGVTLAEHSLRRLQPQVGQVAFNANRNLAAYEAFGVPVFSDEIAGYVGPLAGMLTGLAHCRTPYLVTVPCDTPLFPQDLVARLASALVRDRAEIAMAAAPEAEGPLRLLRPQPVFCLLHTELSPSLDRFVRGGGRRVHSWTAQHATVLVPFAASGDDERAFFNANTLDELRQLDGAVDAPSIGNRAEPSRER
jgi:molybdopterin-guanine dinucleotide biosynthesis protein A